MPVYFTVTVNFHT